jgi:hypothetical protein
MPIRVTCSGCKTTLAVKDHLAGKRVKCPKCQSPLSVPAAKKVAPAVSQAELEALAAAALADEPATPPPVSAASTGSNGSNGQAAAKAPIKFTCEYCDAAIEMEAELAGKKAPCPECRHIIKVPLPKVEKPKDWRTVEKKGPSAALLNQPEKIDNAWGTETKAKVSQTALLEAGVIAKPKAPSIGVGGWVARGLKAAVVVAVVGGAGWVIMNLRGRAVVQQQIVDLDKINNKNWPLPIQGELQIIMAEMALQQPKQRETAREHYIKAFQIVSEATDPADKIDREFFLIRLAKAQAKLGGEEMDIRGQDRFDWNQEVFAEIDRTIKRIEDRDAQVSAVRELIFLFNDLKKPDLALSLTNSIGAITPQAKAIKIAMLQKDEKEAKRLPPAPQAGKGAIDLVVRCGHAEGVVHKDPDAFEKAKDIALLPGNSGDKLQALIAIASWLALDPNKSADVKKACLHASELVKKDARATAWVHLQHVRLTARSDVEEAKALAQKLPPAFRRRAKLEIALAALENVPPPANAEAIIQELDKEGPNRALAWLALARSKARANLSFTYVPDDPNDDLQPFFQAVVACPAAQVK